MKKRVDESGYIPCLNARAKIRPSPTVLALRDHKNRF
jgi:hypothetical protein